MRKYILFFLLSVSGAFLNIGCNIVFTHFIKLPLFLDTIFTVAVTFYAGLWWGILCGALTNIINSMLWFHGWGVLLFAFCSIAAAYITWLFMRLFPRELDMTAPKTYLDFYGISPLSKWMDKLITLILLSFALCLALSILGGIIAAFILTLPSFISSSALISTGFNTTMFNQNIPAVLSETLSRIPINIIDRLISVFAGYGIAVGIHFLRENSARRRKAHIR